MTRRWHARELIDLNDEPFPSGVQTAESLPAHVIFHAVVPAEAPTA